MTRTIVLSQEQIVIALEAIEYALEMDETFGHDDELDTVQTLNATAEALATQART